MKNIFLPHALAVSAAMGGMAEHFGEDKAHWEAVGYVHDVDYEEYPSEHCAHVKEFLEPEGVDETDIRAILSHGYGMCTDVEPVTNMEKSLFTVDELTGIIHAAALMRPTGITDMEVKSLMKKFKDKKFAAGCDRKVIEKGCAMLGMEVRDVGGICIEGMRAHSEALGLAPKNKGSPFREGVAYPFCGRKTEGLINFAVGRENHGRRFLRAEICRNTAILRV